MVNRPRAAIAFAHNGRVIDSQECNGGSHTAFYANRRAFARNAAGFGKDPQFSGSIINLINSLAQETDRLCYVACDGYFLVHEAPGIGRNVTDFGALTRNQQNTEEQDRYEVSNSFRVH